MEHGISLKLVLKRSVFKRTLRLDVVAVGLLVLVQLVVLLTSSASHAGTVAKPTLLYVFAGQSNMSNGASSTTELRKEMPAMMAPQRDVLFWGPTEDTRNKRWVAMAPPTATHYVLTHSGFGPEIGAGPVLAKLHRRATIAFVKLSRPSTSLYKDWAPDNRAGAGMYALLMADVRAAKVQMESATHRPVIVAGFFWLQGESDAQYTGTARAYTANLEAFIRRMRLDLRSPLMPFVIGEIPQLLPQYPRFPYCSLVQSAERAVASQVPRTFYVPTADLARSATSPAHFSTRGIVELGRRFANAKFSL